MALPSNVLNHSLQSCPPQRHGRVCRRLPSAVSAACRIDFRHAGTLRKNLGTGTSSVATTYIYTYIKVLENQNSYNTVNYTHRECEGVLAGHVLLCICTKGSSGQDSVASLPQQPMVKLKWWTPKSKTHPAWYQESTGFLLICAILTIHTYITNKQTHHRNF